MEKNIVSIGVFALLCVGVVYPKKVERIVEQIKSRVITPSGPVDVPAVELDPKYAAAAERAATAFAANKQKSQVFRGYFAAIANEVRESQYLESTADLVQLLERASDRFNAITNSPKVTNGAAVGEAINEVLAIGIGEEIQPLTPAIRESAAKAFEALEWSIQKASA